jgi:hypothetical protein
MIPTRGFIALVPILVMCSMLISIAATASEEAFLAHYRVLQTVYATSASAAARTCAMSVFMHFYHSAARTMDHEEVLLDRGKRCRIKSIEFENNRYEIYTSAEENGISAEWYTEIEIKDGFIVAATSREI